jgi:hypothetical protein
VPFTGRSSNVGSFRSDQVIIGTWHCEQNRITMPDEFVVICPYCGEQVEIYIEPDVRGSFVQDCEICCNPWRVRVSGRADDRSVVVERADGSE